jgi:hypothetical protein
VANAPTVISSRLSMEASSRQARRCGMGWMCP